MSSLLGPLERSVLLRFLSLSFQPPPRDLSQRLEALWPTLPEGIRGEGRALAARAATDLEPEYHRLLGPSGGCPDCESDYLGAALPGKGPVLADVAGFYRAFHFEPERELSMAPDQIAVELSFLGYLSLKRALAAYQGLPEEEQICQQAEALFWREHLGGWGPAFCQAVAAKAEGGFYADAARFGGRALAWLGERPAAAA